MKFLWNFDRILAIFGPQGLRPGLPKRIYIYIYIYVLGTFTLFNQNSHKFHDFLNHTWKPLVFLCFPMKTSVQRIRVGSGRENVRAGDPRILIFPRDFKGFRKFATFFIVAQFVEHQFAAGFSDLGTFSCISCKTMESGKSRNPYYVVTELRFSWKFYDFS